MSFESCQPSTRYISPSRETAQGGAAAVNIYFQFCVDIALQYCRQWRCGALQCAELQMLGMEFTLLQQQFRSIMYATLLLTIV